MTLLWGFPLALAALATLALPLLLHLDRRRSLQTLRFAALRWIGSGHPPRRRLRLTELPLLMLRLLLLASISLWLAQPLMRGEWRQSQRWLAVLPGVSTAGIEDAALDADRVVWMVPAFPSIGPPIKQPIDSQAQPTGSLLRELDAQLAAADTLRVLLPPTLSGLDAQAIALTREVDWRIDPSARSNVELPPAATSSIRVLAVRHEAADDPALDVLRAVAHGWSLTADSALTLDLRPAESALPITADALIWLGSAPSAAALERVASGLTLLHVTPDSGPDGDWPGVARRLGKGRVVTLGGPLQPARQPILQQAELPAELRQLLFGPLPAPALGWAEQVRPTRAEHALPDRETSLRPWLAWLIGALFLLERCLASGRRLRGRA